MIPTKHGAISESRISRVYWPNDQDSDAKVLPAAQTVCLVYRFMRQLSLYRGMCHKSNWWICLLRKLEITP